MILVNLLILRNHCVVFLCKTLDVYCAGLFDYKIIRKGLSSMLTKITNEKVSSLFAIQKEILTQEKSKRSEEAVVKELVKKTRCTSLFFVDLFLVTEQEILVLKRTLEEIKDVADEPVLQVAHLDDLKARRMRKSASFTELRSVLPRTPSSDSKNGVSFQKFTKFCIQMFDLLSVSDFQIDWLFQVGILLPFIDSSRPS